ncbi:4Fe-4S binding protein [Ruminococcaceae bacterium OttesenSCG-928-L11]|nr:4Fe-4S binding protein [Ruminococcaceae bacterium OttesenSCG-928-L11]
MDPIYHSVTLDEDKCKGCTNCIKRCPTQAIRVRDGKARIISERCIDCGECIRVCPHRAKRAIYDPFSKIKDFQYTIALPAPTLYGQFNNLSDIDYVLTGLLDMGFDEVYEVSKSAEVISDATRRLIKEGKLTPPIISSACPAMVRLVRVRFPDLCDKVLPLVSPMHLAAKRAKEEAHGRTGIPSARIGVFFISPCPAKVTDAKNPIGFEKSHVDGVLSMADIYPRLVDKMNRIKTPRPIAESGIIGVSWANSGGESSALIREQYLAADGMENVMKVLEQLEDERLTELDFIELNACPGGCVGGVMTVENPYVAKARIQRLRKYLPVSINHVEDERELEDMTWNEQLQDAGVLQLSDNIMEAMTMLSDIERIVKVLPDLDCGSCGAPSCRTLAEDIVMGKARLNDCIFILRAEASSAGIPVSALEPHSDSSQETAPKKEESSNDDK